MFHVELRHFPANFARFNLTEVQLRTMILERWTREEWIEFGERKWNPQEAKLTVLEGPEIPLDQLTMGRGWRNAQRHSRDVTEEILARTREAQVTSQADSSPADLKLESDSLGLEMLAEVGSRRLPLRRAWELASQRIENRLASQSLALAEGAVRSLLHSGLITISTAADEHTEPIEVTETERDAILGTLESWVSAEGPKAVWISRF